MFFPIIFIAIGLALLLEALGVISGSFWGLFWAIIFLVVGFKMLGKNGRCPICNWGSWHKDCCGNSNEEEKK